MILSLLRKDAAHEAGEALYAAAVEQARTPALYARLGAPDTIEGRFELVALHVYLIMRRLKDGEADAKRVSQKLCDAMFQNMDDSLRELGVGDLSIGKKVRRLAENFYGRVAAYEAAMKNDADDGDLIRAAGRNIFSDEDSPHANAFADYIRRAAAAMETQPVARLAMGVVRFPNAEEAI